MQQREANYRYLRGKILPSTLADVHLVAKGLSGRLYDGESAVGLSGEPLESDVYHARFAPRLAAIREQLAQHNRMTVDDVTGCPLFLTGSGAEIRDRLHAQREETGISYVVVQGRDPELLERFAAEVVTPLAGK